MEEHSENPKPKKFYHHVAKYWPLLALILVATVAALALNSATPMKSIRTGMHYFMGFFFCQFAMLKLFHPAKFSEGFATYDLLAKKVKSYGQFYPILELLIGLAYLAFFIPILTYIVTIIVMAFGAIGVVMGLKNGLEVKCACMGNVLDVPLSTVTLFEDIAMIGMAIAMFFFI